VAPAVLPMYANASARPNYSARPDDAVAELLSLRSKLADRLSEERVGTLGYGFGKITLGKSATLEAGWCQDHCAAPSQDA